MHNLPLALSIIPSSKVRSLVCFYPAHRIDPSVGNLTYASIIDPDSSFWQLQSSSITVNGGAPAISSKRVFLFDSGTSNMLMPQADAEVFCLLISSPRTRWLNSRFQAIYAQISPKIQPFTNEPNTYGFPCSELSTLSSTITFVFTSQDGSPFNLTIPSSELSVGPFSSNPNTCQMLINTMEDTWIVGASVLKHYYSVWDLGGKRMGFAPTIRYGD